MMNKKGNSMVEATLVFPLIILVIGTIILFFVFLYQQVDAQVNHNIYLTRLSGEDTGTMEVNLAHQEVSYEENYVGLLPVYKTSEELRKENSGFIIPYFFQKIDSRTYKIDERKYIRYLDVFEDVIDEWDTH